MATQELTERTPSFGEKMAAFGDQLRFSFIGSEPIDATESLSDVFGRNVAVVLYAICNPYAPRIPMCSPEGRQFNLPKGASLHINDNQGNLRLRLSAP